MVIIQGSMWPQGSQARAYELLHVSITNNGPSAPPTDASGAIIDAPPAGDSYFGHVLARPNPYLGVDGFEADVEVVDYVRDRGIVPLLCAVLNAAWSPDGQTGLLLPPSRVMARATLQDAVAFEQALKGRR